MRRSLPALVMGTIVLIIAATGSVADTIRDKPEAVSLYERARRLMRESNWLEAARLFEELAGRYRNSPNLDLFLFNRAKAQYYFGEHDKALAGFSAFVSRFPGSPYAAHALFFRGNVLYKRGATNRAVSSYFDALAASGDNELTNLLEKSIVGAIANAREVSLKISDFARLPEDRRCRLIKMVAKQLQSRDELEQAQRLLMSCGVSIEIDGTTRSRSRSGGALNIAVVLPFSGELQSFGEEIYQGAVIAAEEYRRKTGKKLRLVPHDTEGDPVNAARIVREAANSLVHAIIGPLTSEEAAVASAALGESSLPLLAPAATEAGLTLLSRTSFQLSPNIELQGVQMADYAANSLGADSAVVITSTSRDHLRMARAFIERFASHGGKVIAKQYYRPRDKDFGDYIRDTKLKLLGLQPDSALFVDQNGDTLDPDGLLAHVDCLYLPGSTGQLRLLLPQVAFYNLDGALLGSDGWGSDAIYKLGDNITRQAVFPSPFLQRRDSEEFLAFSTAYDARYGRQPQRLASLGYDAVRITTQAAERGGTGREALFAELQQLRRFIGAAGPITFGEYRENVEMPIFRIENGAPVYLGTGFPAFVGDTLSPRQ